MCSGTGAGTATGTTAGTEQAMLGPAEFMKLIGGVGNPVMMFMTGKIKARGDMSLATALQNWFETPRS